MKKALALAAMLGMVAANTALASPINVRSGFITPETSSDTSEKTLQEILDTYVNLAGNPVSYNATTSQSSVGVWSPTDGSSATAYLVSLYTAHKDGVLGIYSYTNPIATYDLLPTSTKNFASFGFIGNDLYDGNGSLQSAGFGRAFGFYWRDLAEGYTSYTEDDKNILDGTRPVRALTYQLANNTYVSTTTGKQQMTGGDDWVMAFEDHPQGDYDYNDATFLVKDITPVPEPGTMMMLGAGFLGLAIYGKRRKNA